MRASHDAVGSDDTRLDMAVADMDEDENPVSLAAEALAKLFPNSVTSFFIFLFTLVSSETRSVSFAFSS